MKIDKERQLLFFVSLIGIIVVTLIMGTTFAYQTLIVDYKKGSDNDTIVESGKINVSYENTNKINLKNMTLLPNYKTADYTEFTIKTNDTSYDIAYQINLNNLEYSNSLVSDNFMYTITLIEGDNEYVIGEGDFSSLSGTEFNLHFNVNTYRILEKGKNETLRLYFWLKESNNIQNIENSSFKGNVEIVSLFSNEITLYKTFKVNAIGSQIPSEYQEVEYIKSTGTQYIDTGIIANQKTGFEVEFLTNDNLSNSEFGSIFGARRASVVNELQLTSFVMSDSGFLGTLRYGNNSYNAEIASGVKNKIILKNSMLTKNNGTTEMLNGEFTTPCSLTIFALNEAGTIIQNGSLELYVFKLFDGDTTIRDLIPCYRKSDNVIGLYDLVTNTFYENKGTGIFEKGIDVIQYSTGEYDEANNKYKITITIKIDDMIHSTYDILLDEPLRNINNTYDYIDLINGRIVRNVKVVNDNYVELEEPIYENIGIYNIPYVENSIISICSSNNVCASNIEVELNK